jgi:riboflavin kinase/FMN adenylyltransferase
MISQLARDELARAAPGRPSAVTIGKFDGVHRGHRYLVKYLRSRAARERLGTVIVTLHPSPITVLKPGTPVTYLCSLEERVALLEGLGVNSVGVLSFTSELAQLSFIEFAKLLTASLNMRLLMVGPEFALGRDREGTVDRLRAVGEDLGFSVETVQLLSEDGSKVGSGAVREALKQGSMESANDLLGRPFDLHGPVVHGEERGAKIGFRTANISIAPDLAIPRLGVYVTRSHLTGATYSSVTNIGERPTFGARRPTIETHLLDFEGDCYERELRIEILHRIRDEQRFGSVDELVAQIHRDVESAREYFAGRTT